MFLLLQIMLYLTWRKKLKDIGMRLMQFLQVVKYKVFKKYSNILIMITDDYETFKLLFDEMLEARKLYDESLKASLNNSLEKKNVPEEEEI